jgi:hypothetical protein
LPRRTYRVIRDQSAVSGASTSPQIGAIIEDVVTVSSATVDRRAIAHFATFGFVILRQAFDPEPLARELDAALAIGFPRRTAPLTSEGVGIRFHYLPMMCERTPISLDLVDRFATVAEAIIERPVLPVRAKGTRYLGNAGWHRDTEHDITSVGFACYLEPLTAESGALRLVPGSHRPPFAHAVTRFLDGYAALPGPTAGVSALQMPGVVAETVPGDVIIFDEHLYHASRGGAVRRQWRVDYIAAPADDEERAASAGYLASLFSPEWDGGYDVNQFPTYGEYWRRSRPQWHAALDALGAYAAAEAEEVAARSRTDRS